MSQEYEEALEERQAALTTFSLAHQRYTSAGYLLEKAEEELREADMKLARVLGLPGTATAKLP
jgi:hypothetical protein